MNAAQVFRALGPIDAKSIRRDSLLRWMIFFPIFMALAARWLMPVIVRWVEEVMGVDLLPYYSPIVGYMLIVLTPYLAAVVVGFLLLDQRDDGTLIALQVTPLSLNGYLLYRLTIPMLASILITMVVLPLSGVVPIAPLPLLLVATGAAPIAPLMALALVVIAQNKVQGFAVIKASGIILLPPMFAYFVQGPLQLLLALFPTYWPAMMLWSAVPFERSFWFFWFAGLIYQMILLAILARRFNRVMHR